MYVCLFVMHVVHVCVCVMCVACVRCVCLMTRVVRVMRVCVFAYACEVRLKDCYLPYCANKTDTSIVRWQLANNATHTTLKLMLASWNAAVAVILHVLDR